MSNFSSRPEMKRFEVITTKLQMKRLVKKMGKLEEFAFDTETNSLRAYGDNKDFKVVGLSFSWGTYNNYYIPIGHVRDEDIDNQLYPDYVAKELRPIFDRTDIRLIAHNMKFDLHVLSRLGIHAKTKDLFDTMIASWLCDENSPNGLKENSAQRMQIDQTKFKEVTDTVPVEVRKAHGLKANSRIPFDLVLIEDAVEYAISDAFNTWELYLGYMSELEDEKMDKIYNKVYVPFIRTMYEMEERGVTVDMKRLEEMSLAINKDVEELLYQVIDIVGCEFNPGSNQQLAEVLFGYRKQDKENKNGKMMKANVNEHLIDVSFGFPIDKLTEKGAPSTDSDVLWNLSLKEYKNPRKRQGVEMCKLLLDYMKLNKLKSAFIDGMKEQLYDDGKVHPSFNIIGTDSGRLSCSAPNLQQLPKASDEDKYQIRSLFVGSIDEVTGKRKKIIALDESNLEMRVLGHFSEDMHLLNMVANNDDTHGSTAVNVFELDCTPAEVKKLYPHLRQAAKTINFMLMYGGGAFTLYANLKSDREMPIDLGEKKYLDQYHCRKGEEVAQAYIDKYFKTYSGVATFIKNQKRFAHRNGYVLTVLGRKRRLPNINSHDMKVSSYCERLSVNSCIQGSAADIIMSAQNRVQDDMRLVDLRCEMLIQVHDELVFECPEEYVEEAIEIITHYMCYPFGDNVRLNLPLNADADFGDNYQEAK